MPCNSRSLRVHLQTPSMPCSFPLHHQYGDQTVPPVTVALLLIVCLLSGANKCTQQRPLGGTGAPTPLPSSEANRRVSQSVFLILLLCLSLLCYASSLECFGQPLAALQLPCECQPRGVVAVGMAPAIHMHG